MSYVSFDDEEKIRNFDFIAEYFYKSNFGRMSKSDFELMMFNFYIKKLIKTNENSDGTIDYNKCSDYKISKDLGITQQRVRNLKVKNQLIYPIEYDWKKSFASLTENARYDSAKRKIILNIPDPNLYLEIQNFIEEQGAFIEKQLNSKILQIRVEYYIALIVSLEEESNQKKIIKKLKKLVKVTNETENKFNEKDIGQALIKSTVGIGEIVSCIGSLVSSSNLLWTALVKVLKID